MNWLRKIITSKKFLSIIFIFFGLQAIIYAGYIGFGIPSDENYHYGSIEYYAHQDITTGPFTSGQSADDISIVRAIDRNNSYLYHYALSFPLRLMEAFDLSLATKVFLLRLFSVAFALAGLYVLKKCLDELTEDNLIKNFTIFTLSMTGMAIWLSGSLNYDNLANLLFLLFVLASIKLIKKPDSLKVLLVITLAMATSITKFSFLPILFISAIALLVFLYKKRFGFNEFVHSFKRSFPASQGLTIVLVLSSLLFTGLFIERHGVNLVRYQSVRPNCTEFFTTDQCRTMNVFNRNYKQKQKYSEADKQALIKDFDPFGHTGSWIYGMYNTLYFQLGDRRFESTTIYRFVGFLLAAAILVTLFFSRAKIKFNKPEWFVFIITGSYVLILFLKNLDTLFSIGRKYAYQGRYLLPIMGFLYFFFILLVIKAYQSRKGKSKKIFGYSWLIVLILFFVMHLPPLLLYLNTDSSWQQQFILPEEIVD